MFKSNIVKIFESTQVSEYLTLKRVELDDQTFMKLLGLKPGEINIILSRTASFIKNDGKDKSRKELMNDVLEVLERSAVARQFVGLGLNQEYRLFKGFPVRKGDPYESMPEIGHDLVLQPPEVVIGWETDATQAREDGAKFDQSKGEPIGGLLVETHVDATKILFDVNAVVRACKAKMTLINQYNTHCAPGKSLSKANTDFLATQAPIYHGELEVITNNKVVNTRVTDKWSWDNSNGAKVVKWVGSEHAATNQEQPKQGETAQQEHLREMFNQDSVVEESCESCSLNIDAYHMDEGFMDKMKDIGNWINKTAAITVRGKTMKYLDLLIKQYKCQKQIYELATQFAQKIDKDSSREDYAIAQINRIDELIDDATQALANIQQNAHDALTLATPEEALAEELQNVFNESTLGIFDRVADAMVGTKDRVTHKQLDTIFRKLIRAMEQHYHYRMKALEMQRELLTADYNSYKGTRFENLPSVQKLKSMIEYTTENIRLVQAMKSDFEKNKMDASNFDFTGKSAPQQDVEKTPEDKTHVVALDKKEDELDAASDSLVKKAEVAATEPSTAPTEPEKSVEPTPVSPTPTDDETKDVHDTIDTLNKGFAAAAVSSKPIVPKGFSPEMVANVEKQMRIRKSVWFKKETTAKAFAKANPGWTLDNPQSNVFRVKPPEEGSVAPVAPEVKPEVKAKPIKPAKPVSKPKPKPVVKAPVEPTPAPAAEVPPVETPVAPEVKPVETPAPEVQPEPVAQEPAIAPEVPSQDTPAPAEEPVAQEPPVVPEVQPAPTPAAQKPEKVKNPKAIKPAKTPGITKDTIKPTDAVNSPEDIDKMPPRRKDNFMTYMNAIDLVNSSKEDIERIKGKLKAFPNSKQFQDNLRAAEAKLAIDTNRLNIFKNDNDLRAHISDENLPAAYAAYKQRNDAKVNAGPKRKAAAPIPIKKTA